MRVERVSLFRKTPPFLSIHTELRQIALGKPCAYCGEVMKKVTIDHFWAKSLGGESKINNYIACCEQCNQDKGNQRVYNYIIGNKYDIIGNLKIYLNSLKDTIIDGINYTRTMKKVLYDEYNIRIK